MAMTTAGGATRAPAVRSPARLAFARRPAMETKRVESRARPAWMRSAGFDSAFILGGMALALLSGAVIVIEPSLF